MVSATSLQGRKDAATVFELVAIEEEAKGTVKKGT